MSRFPLTNPIISHNRLPAGTLQPLSDTDLPATSRSSRVERRYWRDWRGARSSNQSRAETGWRRKESSEFGNQLLQRSEQLRARGIQ
jgi:hypothetical protein